MRACEERVMIKVLRRFVLSVCALCCVCARLCPQADHQYPVSQLTYEGKAVSECGPPPLHKIYEGWAADATKVVSDYGPPAY